MNIGQKFSNWWSNLSEGANVTLVKAVGIPLIFLILATPALICWAVGGWSKASLGWLATMAWAFPVTLFGIMFIALVAWVIYNGVTGKNIS